MFAVSRGVLLVAAALAGAPPHPGTGDTALPARWRPVA